MTDASNNQISLTTNFLDALAHEKQADLTATHELLTSLAPKRLAGLGFAVLNLCVANLKTGMGGKQLIELEPDMAYASSDAIDTRGVKVGDIVRLDRLGNASAKVEKKLRGSSKVTDGLVALSLESGLEGVILKMSARSITVAVEGDEDKSSEKALALMNERLWLVQITNSITYKRMEVILSKLRSMKCSSLYQTLLGDAAYIAPGASQHAESQANTVFFNAGLNESQRTAITFALCSPLTIIHGPPGTGKTYTVIELIQQLVVNQGEKVLVCGPSNVSVDTILERLNSTRLIRANRLIRIGHPGRLLPLNYQHSLDILVKSPSSDEGAILNDIRGDINKIVREIAKTKKFKSKREMFAELKSLRRELRTKEKKFVDELIVSSDVVVSTLHGSGARELLSVYDESGLVNGKPLFDTLIIDEVSQALEPQCWIPLINHLGIKKVVIAGDNKQLPPTVKTEDHPRFQKLLSRTIFDRLVGMYASDGEVPFKKLLSIQYRMNEVIMEFSNQQLYHGKLTAGQSVKHHTLWDLKKGEIPVEGIKDLVNEDPDDSNADLKLPFIWYDTQGGDFPERTDDDTSQVSKGSIFGSSKYNEREAEVVLEHVAQLVTHGIPQTSIGVISPYNAQVAYLKSIVAERFPDVELSTIDGFQGREKEAVVISLVRSNDKHEVGFLKDERRLNVALTRARRQLCVVGDMECLAQSRNAFLKALVEYAEEHAEVRYP